MNPARPFLCRLEAGEDYHLDARGELRFVQDWVGHKNVQNTTKYAQITNPRRDEEARKRFADHRVV